MREPGPQHAITGGHRPLPRLSLSHVVDVIRGRLRHDYRHIANKKAPNRALGGEQVAKATAEKVFGWKKVHNHEGTPTFTRQLDGLTIRT